MSWIYSVELFLTFFFGKAPSFVFFEKQPYKIVKFTTVSVRSFVVSLKFYDNDTVFTIL